MNRRLDDRSYKWIVLILAALTGTLTVAMPSMCLPVLFEEIAGDLGLSLVEVGLIWGTGALAGIPSGLVAGAASDRLGASRTLRVACVAVGLAGALRGLSNSFAALAATAFLFGLVAPLILMSITKTCGIWFPRRQLGLANGVVAMFGALGFMASSLSSATLLSPWMGGWRNVLFFYGAASIAASLPWYLTRPAPAVVEDSASETSSMPLRQTVAHVVSIRNVWLLGFILLGVGGCVEGTLGYLPLYLRGLGWAPAAADGALSTFHTASMICVVPIALWSDRLGARTRVLMGGALMTITGVGLLSVADGVLVWAAIGMAGLVRDGFMAVFATAVLETEGVGITYIGTATGLVFALSGLGRLVAPPLGNSLAAATPGLPFVFWAGLAAVGFVGLCLLGREERVLVTV